MTIIAEHGKDVHSINISLDDFNSDRFYCLFDFLDFSRKKAKNCKNLHFKIEFHDARNALMTVKVNKSQGPDNTCGHLLRSCASELSLKFDFRPVALTSVVMKTF